MIYAHVSRASRYFALFVALVMNRGGFEMYENVEAGPITVISREVDLIYKMLTCRCSG